MKRTYLLYLAAGMLGVLIIAPFAMVDAQEPQAEAIGPVDEAPYFEEDMFVMPAELDDPAFGQYVDILALPAAFSAKDPDLLTDVGLQMAYGESILFRPHRAGSAEDTLKLAVQIATTNGNVAALERIEKGAAKYGYDSLVQRIAAAKLAAGESRADEPGLVLSVTESSPDEFAAYGILLNEVESARLLADNERLGAIAKDVEEFKGLNDRQKKFVSQHIRKAQDQLAAGTGEANSVIGTLSQLEGQSRADASQILNAIFHGVGGIVNGPSHGGHNHGGYNQGGYNHGGYNQGGYNRGGSNHSGYNHGGYNQGGYNRGGYNQGGYNHGGYNQGGYNRGGYNQGGYNRGGYNHGNHSHRP